MIMPPPSLHHLIILLFALIQVAAGYGDLRRFLIPNRFPLALILLYPAYFLTASAPVDAVLAGLIALAVFIAGAALFARGIMGGGDVKLMAATALWAGPALFAEFAVVTTLIGGVIAVILLTPQGTAIEAMVQDPKIRLAAATSNLAGSRHRPMPYGVAIALAGLLVAVRLIAH